MNTKTKMLPLPFWIIWSLELWERYGFYGIQSVLMLFLIGKLNFTESHAYILFGTFNAFLFAFIWLGGWIGDSVLGAKRTIVIGALFLVVSYASLSIADTNTIYYSLAGIIVGNSLFKANPSSLISKLYENNPEMLDCAITLYYMSICVGCFIATISIPLLSQNYSWTIAFISCSIGLIIGLIGYIGFYKKLDHIHTTAGGKPLNIKTAIAIIIISTFGIYIYIRIATFTSSD
jgi:POT family proton-dependent oligopeptide transporter